MKQKAKIDQAMILAAGKGTRLKPLTNNCPKALVKFNNKTLLERVLTRIKGLNISNVVVNVHHFPDQIIHFLKNYHSANLNITISDERETLLDTGGAIKKAAPLLKQGHFLLINVDIVFDFELTGMIQTHLKTNALVTLAVSKRNSSRYFLFDAQKQLAGWKNTQTNETIVLNENSANTEPYAFSGIHIISPKIFSKLPDKDVFSIKNLYLELAKEHKILAWEHKPQAWMDAGKYHDFSKTEAFLTKTEHNE